MTPAGSGDVAVRVHVTGRVQGVYFRQSTATHARECGISGWVRNVPDGRVEAMLQGSPAAIEQLLDWIRAGGPPGARVDHLDAIDVPPDPELAGFEVRR